MRGESRKTCRLSLPSAQRIPQLMLNALVDVCGAHVVVVVHGLKKKKADGKHAQPLVSVMPEHVAGLPTAVFERGVA